MDPLYDNALLGILQHEGNIEKFIEVIFGFLMRRTDFYYVHQPGGKLGFPRGFALKMILKAFEKYDTLFKQDQGQYVKSKTSEQESNIREKTDKLRPNKAQPESCSSNETDGRSSIGDSITVKPKPSSPGAELNVSSGDASAEVELKSDGKVVKAAPGTLFKKDEHGERLYEAEPDCYNGARRDLYSWSQRHREIDIHVKIPKHISSARQLTVKIERRHIKITENGVEEPIIDFNLSMDIKTETAQWSFETNEHVLTISLDKVKEYWWDSAFEGEEKINVQEIDCSQPMHELDEEAQGKIAQLLFDQEQKRRGLPTSEEQRIQNILKGAWNKDGSPFKGQPYDPNSFKVETSGHFPSEES